MNNHTHLFWLALCCTTVLLIGCGSTDGPPLWDVDVSQIPDAIPQQEDISPLGNQDSYVVFGQRYTVLPHSHGFEEVGLASWYGRKFHGRTTSSGELFSMYGMTAAHKHLPLPTYVRVTNLNNGQTVVVKVNDRGPFRPGRIIDLSYVAAKKLGLHQLGTGMVRVQSLTSPRRTPNQDPSQETIYFQIAAFHQHQNAQKLVERLRNHFSIPIKIYPDADRLKTVFKVMMGPLAQAQQSQIKQRLHQLGLDRAWQPS